MAEQENFEDDLFADLYNDDEPASKPSAAPQQPVAPAVPEQISHDTYEDTSHVAEQGGGQDYQGGNDYDDDDDVEFDLGNGSTTQPVKYERDETPTTSMPASGPMTKGPNSKEDG